jgi:DNA-binding transcriptional MerR regulator
VGEAPPGEELLLTGEVAVLFRVSPSTVSRWGARGRLLAVRTPAGHMRFFACEAAALQRGESAGRARELALAERARLAASVPGGDGALLMPGDVAALFRVNPKEPARWEAAGLLLAVRPAGTVRQFFASEARALLAGESPEDARKLGLADRERLTGKQG